MIRLPLGNFCAEVFNSFAFHLRLRRRHITSIWWYPNSAVFLVFMIWLVWRRCRLWVVWILFLFLFFCVWVLSWMRGLSLRFSCRVVVWDSVESGIVVEAIGASMFSKTLVLELALIFSSQSNCRCFALDLKSCLGVCWTFDENYISCCFTRHFSGCYCLAMFFLSISLCVSVHEVSFAKSCPSFAIA